MKRLFILLLLLSAIAFALLPALASAQQTKAITRSTASPYGITENLVVPSGKTLTINSGGSIINNGTATGFGGGAGLDNIASAISGATLTLGGTLTTGRTLTVRDLAGTIALSSDLSDYVVGPASTTDGNVTLFDGTTGKLIKSGGTPNAWLASTLDAASTTDAVAGFKFAAIGINGPTDGALRCITAQDMIIWIDGLWGQLDTPLSQFAATTSAQFAGVISDETGTGSVVLATSPTLVTPALGTPSSGTLTNATGLPVSTGISGLGTGVATALATPSSANVVAAVTDETGSGALVFATSPTLVTPALGTPSSGTLTNATGLPLSTGVTGQLPLANGGTGANLTDPGADRILFWDDSAGAVTWLTAGSGLTITDTTITASGSGSSPKYIRLSSDQATTSTSLADCTGMSFSIAANTVYLVEFLISYKSNATTEALGLALNGPASPTSVSIQTHIGGLTVVNRNEMTMAYDDDVIGVSSATTSGTSAYVRAVIVNGANAGTLALRFRTETGGANSSTIEAGSVGILTILTAP